MHFGAAPVRFGRLGLIVAFLVVTLAMAAKLSSRAVRGTGDHMAYFHAAERVAAGRDPYADRRESAQYLYPPFWALAIAPLTPLGPVGFSWAWALAQGVLWLACLALVRGLVKPARAPADAADWLPSALLFRCILAGWGRGQVALLLAALVFAALDLWRRGRDHAAAALVALAAGIKVYPAYLALLFCERGRAPALRTLALFSLALLAAPLVVVDLLTLADWLATGFLGYARTSLQGQLIDPTRFGPVATAWRLAGGEAGPALTAAQLAWLALCSAAVLALRPRPGDPLATPLWMGFAVTTMVVVTPVVGEDFLTVLLLPFAAMITAARALPAAHPARGWLRGGVLLSGFLLNASTPLIWGTASMRRFQGWGMSAWGLLACWVALAVALRKLNDEPSA